MELSERLLKWKVGMADEGCCKWLRVVVSMLTKSEREGSQDHERDGEASLKSQKVKASVLELLSKKLGDARLLIVWWCGPNHSRSVK